MGEWTWARRQGYRAWTARYHKVLGTDEDSLARAICGQAAPGEFGWQRCDAPPPPGRACRRCVAANAPPRATGARRE